MKLKLTILITILLLIAKYSLCQVKPIREPDKVVEWQKIYRCCDDKCYLLKGITEQDPVKEVSRKEVYDNYNEETIIFSSRYCPEIID